MQCPSKCALPCLKPGHAMSLPDVHPQNALSINDVHGLCHRHQRQPVALQRPVAEASVLSNPTSGKASHVTALLQAGIRIATPAVYVGIPHPQAKNRNAPGRGSSPAARFKQRQRSFLWKAHRRAGSQRLRVEPYSGVHKPALRLRVGAMWACVSRN